MNSQHTRRYLFIDFDNLQQVKFRKLEKVATRIFIFTDQRHENVPLSLVQQMQAFGKNLRWIVAESSSASKLNYQMAFVLGKLHQKIGLDVEFAIMSNDAEFDPLVSFINASGRSCVRVKRKREEDMTFERESFGFEPQRQESGFDFSFSSTFNGSDDDNLDVLVEDEIIARTAEETVKRLIRSGNRPADVSHLKNYILLHNQELSGHGHLERIIQRMKDAKDIEIHRGEVTYNF